MVANISNVSSDNDSITCHLFNFSQKENAVYDNTYLASNAVSLLSSVVAIVIVLIAKAYQVAIHRLIFYLSITAVLLLIPNALSMVFIQSESKNSLETIIVLFLMGYFVLVYSLLLSWIGVHVFLLAVRGVHLQKAKHEAFGIVGALLLPLTVTWTIPVYAGSCLGNPKYLIAFIFGLLMPYLLSTIVAALTVISVIVSLCKGMLKIKRVNRRALKELAPFMLFIVVQNINSVFILTDYVLMKKALMIKSFVFALIVEVVFAINFVSIPLLLLSQNHIRNQLKSKRCCKHTQKAILPTTTQRQTTIEQTATRYLCDNKLSSQTHYCVPPETSLTDEDPLIIKQ